LLRGMAFLLAGYPAAERPYQLPTVEFMQPCRKDKQLRLSRAPNLEDQPGLWTLLQPDEIGVKLTEGFMMDPEASVSALVFHHPDCVYFTAAEVGEPALAI